jgi:hypothetical protein
MKQTALTLVEEKSPLLPPFSKVSFKSPPLAKVDLGAMLST